MPLPTPNEPMIGSLAATLQFLGVRIIITHSDGTDGAVVVFVDTEFEPTGKPGLRIILNDDDVFEGVPYREVN